VLSFKSKRKLINVSYQRQADDIISKMTLAALDRELVTREKHQTPSFHCSDPVRSGVSGSSHSAVTPPRSVTFPADLDILWQPTSSAVGRASNHHLTLLNKAIDLLQPYGISIVSSVTAPPDSPFPSTTPVDPRYKYDIFNVRREAEKARPGLPKVLRIIPCLFAPNSHEYGLTEGGGFDGVTFPDFILLNVNMRRVDECLVLHQMIHASGLWDHDESDPANVFSSGADRKHLKPEHAERLSKAYFARPR
jgi:hypothetical protein